MGSFIVLVMLTSFILMAFALHLVIFSLSVSAGRFSGFKAGLVDGLSGLITSKVAQSMLLLSFVVIAYSNVLGNVPGNYTPTQYYSVVMSLSVSFWTPIVICGMITDFTGFFAHMYPNGAPIWLIVLLPVVEFVSIMLRPLILVVRLATNLAAGHILLYIFSYFASLLPAASPLLGVLLGVLFIMEFFISILQAYIFINLLTLYIEETMHS